MATAPDVKSQGMKFAEKQLQRHGWTEGKGLGKKESGISEAIRVKVKCDNAGVGHNAAEHFTFHWWDHVFNKTASSIAVEPDQDGVQVKKVTEDDSTVTNKKPRKALTNRDMLYGRFIKSATLLSGGEKPVEKESESSDSSEDEDEKLDLSSATKITDEDLVKICGGRTAHKGARHGLTMSAKLLRIEEQERAFLEKYGKKESNKVVRSTSGMTCEKDGETRTHKQGVTNEDLYSNTTKCKKKKKKTVHEKETCKEHETNGYEEHVPWKDDIPTPKKNGDRELVDASCDQASSDKDTCKAFNSTEKDSKKKKKKKKRKKVLHEGLAEEEDDLANHAPAIEEAKRSSKKKKADEKLLNGHQYWAPSEDQLLKKKKKSRRDLQEKVEELDEPIEEYVQSAKRKKKQKREEEVAEHVTMAEEECQTKKKKSKSKSKDRSMPDEEPEQAVEGNPHKMKGKKK